MSLIDSLKDLFYRLVQLARSGTTARTRAKTDVFPGCDQTSDRDMDADMVANLANSSEPMGEEAWAKLVREHGRFLDNGGAEGAWQLLSVSGLPMCIYTGAEATAGEQAVLRLKNIEGVDARGARLCYADLSGTYARSADFSRAEMSYSVMIDSWFEAASFEEADLRGVDFSGARMAGANLRDADLRGADFEAADCTGADFRGANLEGARFPGATLEAVKY